MKLISARVTNYKNIIDSGEFTLDDVTCLVGKNQSGKSTLLQALYRLNPVEAGLHQFNYESDYPKAQASEYNKGMDCDDRTHDIVVAGRFKLDDGDLAAIASELGENSLVSDNQEVVISVDYSGSRTWHGLFFDDLHVMSHLAGKSAISEDTTKTLRDIGSTKALKQYFDEPIFNEIDEDIRQELIELRNQNQHLFERGAVLYAINEILVSRVPKFVYYDSFSQMHDHVAVHEFINRIDADQLDANDLPMLGMLKLGGLDPREMIDQNRSHERNTTEIETANDRITWAIKPYWKVGSEFRTVLGIAPFTAADDPSRVGQPSLTVRVSDVQGASRPSAPSTSLGARSRGFQWMFSFACLLRFLEEEYDQLVVLLDEPGQSLHGDAQRELVKLIRSQSGSSKQFLYTTHSPFMIDPDRLEDVRIVDGTNAETGAVVRDDVDSVGNDSLLPLQSALGYSVLAPLMIGPNVLLVEGVSDIAYLRAWQSLMLKDGRESLDERWTIVPCGGIEKIPGLISLLHAKENLNLAVLCDGSSSSQDGISNSARKKIIRMNRIVYLADHLNRKHADIEDLFNPGTYLDILYKTTGCDVKVSDLPKGPSRILQRLKDADFEGVDSIENEAFHYRCSKTFEQDAEGFYRRMSDTEKDRIEGLFKVLNSMLPDEPKATTP